VRVGSPSTRSAVHSFVVKWTKWHKSRKSFAEVGALSILSILLKVMVTRGRNNLDKIPNLMASARMFTSEPPHR